MLKKVLITGKRNEEGLKKEKGVRVESKKWSNLDNFKEMDKYKQIELLNRLYLGENYEGKKFVEKEINRKVNGYKNQDVKKKVYNKEKMIRYDDVIEKLVISKLRCYYCRKDCLLMYENIREMNQWTLDRINNDIGHFKDNVVICCLRCNLKKGTKNDEHFKFAKQMKIIKKY